ncbi:hypothetical protein [Streptomyces sp. Ac-502]|uniref:hypothetical protein n=1 Tax=Streptomyces sp. Ac-502 TaxID=3342801 RepID=UPI00386256E6
MLGAATDLRSIVDVVVDDVLCLLFECADVVAAVLECGEHRGLGAHPDRAQEALYIGFLEDVLEVLLGTESTHADGRSMVDGIAVADQPAVAAAMAHGAGGGRPGAEDLADGGAHVTAQPPERLPHHRRPVGQVIDGRERVDHPVGGGGRRQQVRLPLQVQHLALAESPCEDGGDDLLLPAAETDRYEAPETLVSEQVQCGGPAGIQPHRAARARRRYRHATEPVRGRPAAQPGTEHPVTDGQPVQGVSRVLAAPAEVLNREADRLVQVSGVDRPRHHGLSVTRFGGDEFQRYA